MAKAKGRECEQAVCDYLRARGIPAERRRLTGSMDAGDVAGWHLVTVEAKACKTLDFPGWMDEAEAEQKHADARFHAGVHGYRLVVAKRRGETDPAKWFAVMPLSQAVTVIEGNKKHTAGPAPALESEA